jgi:two-component system sensor histidine kinase QseC
MSGAFRSLTFRLILGQMVACIGIWGFFLAWSAHQATRATTGDLDRSLGLFGLAVAQAQRLASPGAELAQHIEPLQRLYADIGFNFYMPGYDYQAVVQVLNADQQVVYRSAAAPLHAMPTDRSGFVDWKDAGQLWRLHVTPTGDGGHVVVADSAAFRRLLLSQTMIDFVFVPFLLSLPMMAVIATLLVRRGLRPLRQLAGVLESRHPRDLTPIELHRRPPETRAVVQAVNLHMQRVCELLEREKSFLANAAHELRTPLAAIRAQAYVVSQTDEPADRALARAQLEAGLDRASSVVNQLLALARLTSEARLADWRSLDLVPFCRARLSVLAPIALRRDVDFSLEAPNQAMVWADIEPLTSLIDNLVDNAFRYCREHGDVEVRIVEGTRQGGGYTLTVADDGPGIAEADRERVFQRFIRLPSGLVESGSGLGLAIAREAAAKLGASLYIHESAQGQGAVFVLEMPDTHPGAASPLAANLPDPLNADKP